MRFHLALPGIGRGIIETSQGGYDTWYVDSNGNAGSGRSPKAPVATVDEAINLAGAGDTVYIAEGHAETLANATSLVMDVAGLKIIGLGRGSRRPKFTMTGTGSNIPISGIGSELHNVYITTSGTVDVVKAITVSAADVLLKDIEMEENANDSQFVDGISAATCKRLEVDGFRFFGLVGGDATQSALQVTDTSQFVRLRNCWIVGEFVTGGLEVAAVLDVVIENVMVEQRHANTDACMAISTTAKGFMVNCQLRSATNDDPGLTAIITASGALQYYNVGIVNNDGEHAAVGEVEDLDVTNSRSGKTFSTIA